MKRTLLFTTAIIISSFASFDSLADNTIIDPTDESNNSNIFLAAGNVFEYRIDDMGIPAEERECYKKFITKDETHNCLKWASEDVAENDPETVLFRVEGDKIYFLFDSDTPEWVLMYDFNLGETPVEFGNARYNFNHATTPQYMELTCVQTFDSEAYPGQTGMEINVINPSPDYEPEPGYYDGIWIKGIGDPSDFSLNQPAGVGLRPYLIRITNANGDVILEHSEVAGNKNMQEDASSTQPLMIFNSQGQYINSKSDLNSLDKGIYIIRQGTKTKKVII